MSTFPLPPSSFTATEPSVLYKAYRSSLETDVFGPIFLTNALLPLIERGTEKKIIFMTSGMADISLIKEAGIPYAVAPAAGKAAMNVVAAKYAVELAEKGVKTLALSPGWVDTWEGPSKLSISFTFQ
jgi:NAD(P)-dependent dehydrogenase (short-subunit alcohol dehydrogenase family)